MTDQTLQLGARDVLIMAALLALTVSVAVILYRAMQKPRLRLVPADDGWRTTRRDILLYAVVTPVLLFLWWSFLINILALVDVRLDALRIVTISGGIVLATRLLAHIWYEPANELSKSVPLTVITLFVISGAARDQSGVENLVNEIGQIDFTPQALIAMVLADWLITFTWYSVGVRGLSARGVKVPGVPSRSPG